MNKTIITDDRTYDGHDLLVEIIVLPDPITQAPKFLEIKIFYDCGYNVMVKITSISIPYPFIFLIELDTIMKKVRSELSVNTLEFDSIKAIIEKSLIDLNKYLSDFTLVEA